MISLSPIKLLVVLVVAMILLGPDKVPQVARQLGAAWGAFRQFREKFETEVRDTVPGLPSTQDIVRAVRSPASFLDRLADDHAQGEGDESSAGADPYDEGLSETQFEPSTNGRADGADGVEDADGADGVEGVEGVEGYAEAAEGQFDDFDEGIEPSFSSGSSSGSAGDLGGGVADHVAENGAGAAREPATEQGSWLTRDDGTPVQVPADPNMN